MNYPIASSKLSSRLVLPRYAPVLGSADKKFNVNSWCRDKATEVYGKGFPDTPFPDVQEEATEAFAAECERFMKLLGSSGKA